MQDGRRRRDRFHELTLKKDKQLESTSQLKDYVMKIY